MTTCSRRLVSTGLALALALPPSLRAQTAEPDPDLDKGVRLVESGEYADALLALDAAARRLEAAKAKDRSRLSKAYLYLGIAYIGLSHEEAAKSKFQAALNQTPDLALSPDQYPPKVIEAFEAARHQAGPAPKTGGGSKKGLVLLGVGAAAAGGIALAAAGGGNDCAKGRASFANARFDVPVFECPDGAGDFPDPATIVIDAVNSQCSAVTINSATTTLTIVATSGTSNSVGQNFNDNAPRFQPSSVAAGGTTVAVRVTPKFECNNPVGPGSVATFNEFVGNVTLQTSAGTVTLRTLNTHRSNFP